MKLFFETLKKTKTFFLMFLSLQVIGQSTTITPGTGQPNITANSTTNGIVFPRMTTTQKEAINPLSAGTVVYDVTLNCLSLYNGISWTCLNAPYSTNAPLFQNFNLAINPSGNAPLAGVISVTSNQPIKLSYIVKGQDGEDFAFGNDKFSVDNDTTINLYALYPSFTNTVVITITNQAGYIQQKTVYVTTAQIPSLLPQPNEIVVNARTSGLLTKFILGFPYRTRGTNQGGYPTIFDTFGKIRGYITMPLGNSTMMLNLQNGHYLLAFANEFREIDLLGNLIRTIPVTFLYHHDVTQLPNGNLLFLGDSPLNNTIEDKVYTMDFNTGVLTDSLNLYTILDPSRPLLPSTGSAADWFHANALKYDAIDNSIIVSGRHQSAVVKIDLTTKQLKWILSDPTHWNATLSPYLLTPSGTGFEYSYGQHSSILKPGDNRTMLVFDNGNSKGYTNQVPPTSSYSRMVEYTFDESNNTIVQNFEFGKAMGSSLYASYVGEVEYINSNRFFADFGGIVRDINNNATEIGQPGSDQTRFFETDRNNTIYLDIAIKNPNQSDPQLIGIRNYRAHTFSFK